MISAVQLQRFWGKARPQTVDGLPMHPLIFHMLDVAACAGAILETRAIARSRATAALGLNEGAAQTIVSIVAALHDLGKFSAAFQAKAPEHFPQDVFGRRAEAVRSPSEHDVDGRMLWEDRLREPFGEVIWPGGGEALSLLIAASVGHHGRPVSHRRYGVALEEVFLTAGVEAAEEGARRVTELLQGVPISAAHVVDVDAVRRASFWFAGLITIADWIGSSQTWFPYATPDIPLDVYWTHARKQAARAVKEAGLVSAPSAPSRSFLELARLPTSAVPTPLQRLAADVSLRASPLLLLIEDVTGAGKTEAAQMLTHRLMRDRRVSGAFWGMPTQATANAMYARQNDMLAQLFAPSSHPSLVLAHGQAKLHDQFSQSILQTVGREETALGDVATDETASAACAAFLAEDKRAAMIADIGSGTIDQAILAALPARFHTVRLFGLAEKVLIIDEAHAYDSYMGAEIEGLLRFQAALGGCAIILSATLPRKDRERFVRAWREGLGERSPRGPLTRSEAYPLLTIASKGQTEEHRVDAAQTSCRTTPVRFVENESAILKELVTAAQTGAAVAWVRNTVDDVIRAAEYFRAEGLSPIVFHARFVQGDRQHIEAEVMRRLGKAASHADRSGTVVVATQVIEQSLDLDVDLMASDLAPVDLLIQRAGRLRRHRSRDEARPDVPFELLVLSPHATDAPKADWLSAAARASEWIYKDPAILWRTRRILGEARAIDAPAAFRTLIEAVYAPPDEAPEGLRAKSDRAAGEAGGERSLGQTAVVSLNDGYVGEARAWQSEERVPTRLGEPQTTLRLARVGSDGSLAPFIEAEDRRRAWALSEVRVSAYRAPEGAHPMPHFQPAAQRARAEWGRLEQERTDLMVLPLEEGGAQWVGRLVLKGAEHAFTYTETAGLSFSL